MTYFDANILAQIPEFDGDVVKLIFMIVVGTIVGIGSLVSAAKKKQQEQAQRELHRENWEQMEQEMRQRAAMATRALSQGAYPAPPPPPHQSAGSYPTAAPPPVPVFAPTRSIEGPYIPSRPAPRRPAAVRPPPVPRTPPRPSPPFNRPQVRRLKKKKVAGLAPAPPLPRAAAEPEREAIAPARAADVPTVSRERAAATVNAAAVAGWLNAGTLRSQFILTEILRPPLALRDPTDPQS